ncbi:uncharacterized protein UDID_07738 [Ustilago sp. UG-2017a]|nr:uncharacterized protein UDID_07738 [Ustilago sp. UG-2017a]
MSVPTPATQPVKTKSKAYSSTVAIQGDAAKYRLKYKELKKKVREIEVENDKLHLKTLRIKRNIQRMRLERAILYERLEAESQATPSVATYPPPPPPSAVVATAYDERGVYQPAAPGSSSGARRVSAEYAGYGGAGGALGSVASGVGRGAYGGGGAGYDDYPPPPPPQRGYAASSSYDSPRHHSPQAAGSVGDRAERLRQYTKSPSPEPHAAVRRGDAGTPPPRQSADPASAEAGVPASSSRSSIKVKLRRGL